MTQQDWKPDPTKSGEHIEPREFWIEPNDGEVFDFEVEGYIHVREVKE